MQRFVVGIFVSGVLFLGTCQVRGQTYPTKPIRMIVSEAGSSPDIIARTIVQGIAGPLGQPVIVENRRPLLIPEILQKATPDGYTVALGGTTFWTGALLQQRSYDPVKTMSPITLVVSSPSVIVVHPSVPVKSVKELIDLAKARPGVLNYAQGPPGGGVHLAGALFQAMSGVNMVFVPYSAAALGVNAVISGETQVIIYNPIALMPHVKAGRLRALAVTSAEPTPLVPGVPTVTATGLPGYEYVSILGVFAPAGAPEAIINRLHQEIVRTINKPDVKEKFFNLGADIVGSTPAQFAAKTKAEMIMWTKVIKDAGIKVD